MFKPSRRYRRRNLSFKKSLLLSLFIFILCVSLAIWLVNEKMKPALFSIAETQTEQMAHYAINYGIGEHVLSNITKENDPNEIPKIEELFITHRTEDQKITDFELNSEKANQLKGQISNRILWFLRAAEKGRISFTNGPEDDLFYSKNHHGDAIIADIPLGQILNNALLSNYGPRVPVEMEVVSNVETDIKEEYKNAGINNPLYSIYMVVTVKVDVIVPFAMKSQTIKQRIPIGLKGLNPGVPYFYGSNGAGVTPTVPIETPSENKKSNR